MFLAYISQMLSSYDFENECYLDELLMKLATKYPNGELIEIPGNSNNHEIILVFYSALLSF